MRRPQREHLAGDHVEEAEPVLGLDQRLRRGQAHAGAEAAVEAQDDRLLQRLALGLGVGRQVVDVRQLVDRLDPDSGTSPVSPASSCR